MTKDNLYLLIGSVFIEATKRHSKKSSYPTTLAKEIASSLEPVTKKKPIGYKTLVDYFKYYCLYEGDKKNPEDESLIPLINYLFKKSFTSKKRAFEYFEENISTKEFVDKHLPFKKTPKEDVAIQKFDNKSNNAKQKIQSHSAFIIVLTTILSIVALTISGFYYFNKKGDTNINIEGLEINNDFKQIYPTQNTRFFNDDNEPVVWYANSSGKYRFFNRAENPNTKEVYTPISREIINAHFLTKIPQKRHSSDSKTISQTSSIESNKPKDKEGTLLNTSLVNTIENKEISILIFDSINKIDTQLSKRLGVEFRLKKYKVTAPLLISDKLTVDIKEHLLSGDIAYFNDEIKKYTDFICVGTVHYLFKQNKILPEKTTCTMYVTYSIFSSHTAERIESYSNTISGYGPSEILAKYNTIKKFNL